MSKTKSPETVPFSLRLRIDEHAALKRDAVGTSMAALIRQRLFAEPGEPRKTRGKFPVKDRVALGKVLGQLGASGMSSNLHALAEAAQSGCLIVDARIAADLTKACRDINVMRAELMKALGVREKESVGTLKDTFDKAIA